MPRLDGPGLDRVLVPWLAKADPEDRRLVVDALMNVNDESWRHRYPYSVDPVHKLTFHIEVRSDLVVTVRFTREYPNIVQLIRIGSPDAQ